MPEFDHLDAVDSLWLQRFRRNLRRWHKRNGRDLPWRNIGEPYRVWISEIMLQQTTVVAVVPYFNRFLDRFPTIQSLAAADENEVLRHWEGLGYYSRARNIHKTARQLVESNDGEFPRDVKQLQQLPGIGRYTAGAIASFAFDRPAPIVEANTLRLYCRLLGFADDPRTAAGQRLLWEFAERLLPRKSPGRFNQALMDLGATRCTPTKPDCPTCPVRSCCRAVAEGSQESIPMKAVRPQITNIAEAAVAVHRKGRYLLRRIPDGQRWAGLWDFVRFPLDDHSASKPPGRSEISSRLTEASGLVAEIGPRLAKINHSVTRYRIQLFCFPATYHSGDTPRTSTYRWVSPKQFADYPLSVTGRQFADLLVGS
jgi:A/G-specific adenine glycosylase